MKRLFFFQKVGISKMLLCIQKTPLYKVHMQRQVYSKKESDQRTMRFRGKNAVFFNNEQSIFPCSRQPPTGLTQSKFLRKSKPLVS